MGISCETSKMNKYLEELNKFVIQNTDIQENQLIDALFILRAHYDLAGIVIICQRINELIEISDLYQGSEFSSELETLRVISRLPYSEEYGHFFSETTNKNKHKLTPLRPYTGDSGICDLLLIETGLKKTMKVLIL